MKQIPDTSTAPDDRAALSSGSTKFNFRHLVVPTDLSLNSERAVDCAVQLAKRLKAKLTLLHVIPEPSALDYSMEGVSMQEIHGWEEEAEEKLVEQLRHAQLEYKDVRSLQFYAPHPHDQIASAVTDLSADLLVISTHRYMCWKHRLFGSGAGKILQQASCPVLVVR